MVASDSKVGAPRDSLPAAGEPSSVIPWLAARRPATLELVDGRAGVIIPG